jgi:hypothetical protein
MVYITIKRGKSDRKWVFFPSLLGDICFSFFLFETGSCYITYVAKAGLKLTNPSPVRNESGNTGMGHHVHLNFIT